MSIAEIRASARARFHLATRVARSEQVPEAVLSIVLFRTNYGFEHSILFWVRASLTDVPQLLR